ncbi:MAG TPA: PrsW family intramembrane metalloprotease, partial [Micromonosporaceae bacterium]|nr:PrsW family intramembrane metalloprotease [Micromonosporaceae bacterium]
MTDPPPPGQAPDNSTRWRFSVRPTPRQARALQSVYLPAFWILCLLLVLSAWRLGVMLHSPLARFPGATLTAILLFAVWAVPFWLFIASMDFLEREPPLLLATAFAWGGLVATSLAGSGSAALHNLVAKWSSPAFAAAWGPALVGPTVEETVKALGIVAIVLVAGAQLNSVLDGVVYGALVGLGFQVVEDVVFAVDAVAFAGGGDRVDPVVTTFLLRGFLAGLWSHTLFGALAGAGVGYLVVRVDRSALSRVGAAALALGGAWACHFVWNSPLLADGLGYGGLGVLAALLIKGVPPLLMILLLVRAAGEREADYYTAQLIALDDRMVITPEELRVLPRGGRRVEARRYAHGRAGIRGRRAVRRL